MNKLCFHWIDCDCLFH